VLPEEEDAGFGIVRSHHGHMTLGIFNRTVAARELKFSVAKLLACGAQTENLRAIAGAQSTLKLTADYLSVTLDRKSFVLLSNR
jgi:hypothetical protein